MLRATTSELKAAEATGTRLAAEARTRIPRVRDGSGAAPGAVVSVGVVLASSCVHLPTGWSHPLTRRQPCRQRTHLNSKGILGESRGVTADPFVFEDAAVHL